MIDRVRRSLATHGLLALAATAVLLTGCGQNKTAATNSVEMRDMEVVDGTVNDAMTDLDAASTSGTGVGNNAGTASSAGKKATTALEAVAKDAEAVASE